MKINQMKINNHVQDVIISQSEKRKSVENKIDYTIQPFIQMNNYSTMRILPSQRERQNVSKCSARNDQHRLNSQNDQLDITKKLNIYDIRNKSQNYIPFQQIDWIRQNSSQKQNIQVRFNSIGHSSTQIQTNRLNKRFQKQQIMNLQLKQQTQNLRSQIYELRNVQIAYQEIRIQVRQLENQNKQKSIQIQQLTFYNQTLGIDLENSKKSVVQWIRKVQSSTRIISNLQENIYTLKSDQDSQTQKTNIEIQKLIQVLKNLQFQNSQKTIKISELNRTIENLYKQLQISKKQVVLWIQKVDISQKRINQMIKNHSQYKIQSNKKQCQVEENIKNLKNKISDLERIRDYNQKNLNQIEINIQNLYKDLNDKRQQISYLNQVIQKIKKSLHLLQQKNILLNQNLQQKQKVWNAEKLQIYKQAQKNLDLLRNQYTQQIFDVKEQIKIQVQRRQKTCEQKYNRFIVQLRQINNSLIYEISQLKLNQSELINRNSALTKQLQNLKQQLKLVLGISTQLQQEIAKIKISIKENQTNNYHQVQDFNEKYQITLQQNKIQLKEEMYVPKKWFQQKLQYQYKICELSNQIQSLKTVIQKKQQEIKQKSQINNQNIINNINQKTKSEQIQTINCIIQTDQEIQIVQKNIYQKQIQALKNQIQYLQSQIKNLNIQIQKSKHQSKISNQMSRQQFDRNFQQQKNNFLRQKEILQIEKVHLKQNLQKQLLKNKQLESNNQNLKKKQEIENQRIKSHFLKLIQQQIKKIQDLKKLLKQQKQLNQDLTMQLVLKQNKITEYQDKLKSKMLNQ